MGIAVTLIEAAALLGLNPATLRQQIHAGALKATKRGRDWFVDPKEVERYAKENRRGSRAYLDEQGRRGAANLTRSR